MITLITLVTILIILTLRGVSNPLPLILCSLDIISRVGRTGISIMPIPTKINVSSLSKSRHSNNPSYWPPNGGKNAHPHLLTHEEFTNFKRRVCFSIVTCTSCGNLQVGVRDNGRGKPTASVLSADGFPLMAGPNFQTSDGNPTVISILRQLADGPKNVPEI
jgi:hypothetical protein